MTQIPATNLRLLIITPVFNDWVCLDRLLPRIDSVLHEYPAVVSTTVLAIDDASTVELNLDFDVGAALHIKALKILRQRRNLGHQRTIGIGLSYAEDKLDCDIVVVMDSDGEDRPEDIPLLIDEVVRNGFERVVFAERARRTESMLFRIFYHLYRLIHLVLTGLPVRVGNFSALPMKYLSSFTVISESWSHYAAAIYTASIPRTQIPISRGNRLAGKTHMNFTSLVTHGLSALAVHGAVIGVRMLIASSAIFLVSALGTLCCAIGYWSRHDPDLRLYSLAGAFFTLGLFLMCLFIFALNLILLNNRSHLGFLPVRDYQYFVDTIYDHPSPR